MADPTPAPCAAAPSSHPPPSPHTGTTIVAATFPGGVVIGADSRVSTGAYVSNRASDKLHRITDDGSVWLLRSGSAADCQAIGDAVRHHADQLATELGRPPTVAALASVVRSINYANKEALMGALLVAGWDAVAGGQIYGVPIGGALVPQRWATDGSGSTYIWGYLDSAWREGMTREEAEALVTTALALAVSTDGSSGGMARLVTVTAGGAVRTNVSGDKMPQFGGSLEAGGGGGDGIVVV